MGFIKVKFGVFQSALSHKGHRSRGYSRYDIQRYTKRGLEELDIKPIERRRFRVFGRYVERDISVVGMEILGRRAVTVIMGKDEDQTKSY